MLNQGAKGQKYGYCTYIYTIFLNLKYQFVSTVSGLIKQNDTKQPTKQNKKKVFRQKLFQKVKTKTKKLKSKSKKHHYNKI